MNDVAVERFYVVAVELADGKQSAVKVRGDSPADAFRAARAENGVRRVGKVTEISESAFHAEGVPSVWANSARSGNDRPGREPGRRERVGNQGEAHARGTSAGQQPEPSVRRESLIGFTISGPRVVLDSRKTAVEQPFKNLKAPPGSADRGEVAPPPEKKFFSPFNPATPTKPLGPPIFTKPAPAPVETPVAEAKLAETPAAGEAEGQGVGTTAYRIVKSRRREGHPYLLQRGVWKQQKGKRVFEVDWEKGFDDREKAEKHQGWLEQVARETAELTGE